MYLGHMLLLKINRIKETIHGESNTTVISNGTLTFDLEYLQHVQRSKS